MDTMKLAFWEYSTQLVDFIVPAIVIYMVMKFAADLLLGANR
jgi:hypothetical protein